MRLILASASPRRAALLRDAGIEFDVVPSVAVECDIAGDPVKTAVGNASAKATEVFTRVLCGAEQRAAVPVLGADTVVSVLGRILGKPKDKQDAEAMLLALSGRTHEVITGLALVFDVEGTQKTVTAFERTRVTFNQFDKSAVIGYIESGKPLDKAGAYGIQDAEIAAFISKVEGARDNVIGLPALRLIRMLEENRLWQ